METCLTFKPAPTPLTRLCITPAIAGAARPGVAPRVQTLPATSRSTYHVSIPPASTAQAGGTPKGPPAAKYLRVLPLLRESSPARVSAEHMECEWRLPQASQAGMLDVDGVHVWWSHLAQKPACQL